MDTNNPMHSVLMKLKKKTEKYSQQNLEKHILILTHINTLKCILSTLKFKEEIINKEDLFHIIFKQDQQNKNLYVLKLIVYSHTGINREHNSFIQISRNASSTDNNIYNLYIVLSQEVNDIQSTLSVDPDIHIETALYQKIVIPILLRLLYDKKIIAIFSSPLKRAFISLDYLLMQLKLNITTDKIEYAIIVYRICIK